MLRLQTSILTRLSAVSELLGDLLRLVNSAVRSQGSLVAENLFLRKQLAFYQERKVRPRRLTDAARLTLVLWSRWFSWKDALIIVKPETLIGWHRKDFRLFWHWKSRPGRPRLPRDIRELIARMARENPTWGQARVAAELSLKLGIVLSPRTVRKYWPWEPSDCRGRRVSAQQWKTFLRNHAKAIVACDFLLAVTARFQFLYVLVILELGSRRILHCNVTAHPTAEWTVQQFREAIPSEQRYRFLIHDRDSIFSADFDRELTQGFGLTVLRTPPQSPQANAHCERLVGTVRRECLDFVIPLTEKHLRRLLGEWVRHYNGGRPHRSLGPGIPDQGRGTILINDWRQSPHNSSGFTIGCPLRSWWIAPRICLGQDCGMKRRATSLIKSPLDWDMAAAPVPHPVIPVLADRGGTQLRTPRCTIIVDTREQNPFDFSRFEGWFARVETRALKLGDYSIAGLEDRCVVERKDLSDLICSFTADRSVFVHRLRLMSQYPHRLLLITTALSQIKSPQPHGSGSPNRLTQSLIAVLAGLQIPFLCTESHELGEEMVASYLCQVHLYHWLEAND